MPRSISSGLEVLHREQGERTGREVFDLDSFSFAGALEHPFVKEADQVLTAYAREVGYSEEQWRRLLLAVHHRFVTNFKLVLAASGTKERFDPLTRVLSAGTGESAVYRALQDHAEFQRRLFEERPVFDKEPFTLAQIYVEPDCRALAWGQLREADGRPTNSANSEVTPPERFGEGRSMAEAVLAHLADPDLKDAIVIEGPAGAGKSSFTLWLCRELLSRGLQPIRVLLRDIQPGGEITEALDRGIHLPSELYGAKGLGLPRPDRLLLDFVFRQSVPLGEATICPYVLILDGWDEISLSASADYRTLLEQTLTSLRRRFLSSLDGEVTVRVVLTGRPSQEVRASGFLRTATPILIIQPLRPERLEEMVGKVAERLRRSPTDIAEATGWKVFSPDRLASALRRYREDFAHQQKEPLRGGGPLEVLGLPLLTHLALRLLSHPEVDVEAVIARPTSLYRGLVDLTCGKAGKPEEASDDVEGQHRIKGESLRELLWWTAAAMTVHGRESIPYEELKWRLEEIVANLMERVETDTKGSVLSQLVVSYFFKGGHTGRGCEFLHKSFREYLFAEGVVEMLKRYGRAHGQVLGPRDTYWKDFQQGDPRYELSRDLGRWLSPQWITPDFAAHLDDLLAWEIRRSLQSQAVALGVGLPTTFLGLERWERVRDALADLWDWWAEGVHLRPQPTRSRGTVAFARSFGEELVEWSMPVAREAGSILPAPKRITTIDSHLGDALFRLAAAAHSEIAATQGWRPRNTSQGLSEGDAEDSPPESRRAQWELQLSKRSWRLFSAGGRFFVHYRARIDSAGWRPQAYFPTGCRLCGVGFALADLSGADLHGADLQGANLRGASLTEANLEGANLEGATLDAAFLEGTRLLGANLVHADLGGAVLYSADLRGTNLSGANFRGAYLLDADFSAAIGADLTGALNVPERFSHLVREDPSREPSPPAD